MRSLKPANLLTLSFLLGLLCFTLSSSGGLHVAALPCLPEHFYGTVSQNGIAAADGIEVDAVSSGTTYGTTSTSRGGYSVDAGNITLGCPAPGATMNFNVGGNIAAESASFFNGGDSNLNLTVSVPDFTVAITPTSQVVTQGHSSAPYTVTVTSIGGFSSPVALSNTTSFPQGTTFSLLPTPVTPPPSGNINATLTVNTAGSTPVGTYTLNLKGQSGAIARPAQTSLVVQSINPNHFALGVSPTSNVAPQGGQATFLVNITSLNGFAGSVLLTSTGTPNGLSFSSSPNPVTPAPNTSAFSTLTFTISSSAAPTTYNLTIIGQSSSPPELHTISILLTVTQSSPTPLFTPLQLIILVALVSISPILIRRRKD